ncbi:MAG: hypothetical protein M1396_01020 [Chloroflexi bacterium]|nr:hypothetical protein [Chloroflexota bacterium]
MGELIWVCNRCWTSVWQKGGRLYNPALGKNTLMPTACGCCRSSLEDERRLFCFLVIL